ncbi:MAG: hypothetical protein KZQ95_10495 [Candidatus Thiodiazotropha sp. (ex Epidulcina cf. delphinae)]|nr:hypothetical protein [Candidatus Thiodiazotropha sp. (ex Epidulcina cf. delphinae)]
MPMNLSADTSRIGRLFNGYAHRYCVDAWLFFDGHPGLSKDDLQHQHGCHGEFRYMLDTHPAHSPDKSLGGATPGYQGGRLSLSS